MTEKFKFSTRSKTNLIGVYPRLVECTKMALHISDVDFAVVEGLRTPERQQQLYAQGRTAPGKIVTWTMASKHLKQADGWGHAVDLLPINPATGKLDWNYANGFAELGDAMSSAADYLGDIQIRWGADWDQDGIEHERGENDSPHFELV